MPILTVNGEKKKVACGPCIRGHRSSKCAHKDRVLIEVRKPGRPLGTCPHPAGSCSCERVVINYMIPKERPGSIVTQGVASQMPTPTRIQKKSQRSVANLSQSTVQKVISGDPSALAALANFPVDKINNSSSDTSSQPPSTSSSTNSTPKIDALQGTPHSFISETHLQDRNGYPDIWRNLGETPVITKTEDLSDSSPPTFNTASCCCAGSSSAEENITYKETNTASNLAFDAQPTSIPRQPQQTSFSAAQIPFNHHDFPSFELTIGCGGMAPGTSTIHERLQGIDHSQCGCGDNCDCFACATHPTNRTTLDYVKFHNELLSKSNSGPPSFSIANVQQSNRSNYNLPFQYNSHGLHSAIPPSYAHHFGPQIGAAGSLGYGVVDWVNMNQPDNSIPQTPISEMERLHFQTGPVLSSHPTTLNLNYPLYQKRQNFDQFMSPTSMASPSIAISHNVSQPQAGVLQTSTPTPSAPLDADSPMDDDTSTLSPSSFLFQQFTLPGCDDITGTCQCGDGCACTGCLTHSGHRHDEPNGLSTLQEKSEIDSFLLSSNSPQTASMTAIQ